MAVLVDFHCHLDLFPDLPAAIADAEAAGVYTLSVTTTPLAWARNYELSRKTKHVRAALGMHPQLVAERSGEFRAWESHLAETRYVGEVGLDAGPRFYRSLELQKSVFDQILRACATAGGKILTVHSVRAVKQTLDAIEQHLPSERGQAVLHWFTGSISEARRATALGCYFSINAQMTNSDRGRALIKSLPIKRLLTETDAPFTLVDQRPSQPSDVAAVVRTMAGLLGLTGEEMRAAITQNLRELIGSNSDSQF